MAGLLAWAADVVTGNGVAGQEPEEDEQRTIRFSAEQQEVVRQLDTRAASLQHSIQHLRLRIPPPDISRSLPQLHSDSLAAHSALTSELNAHQATQEETQTREATLQAEIEAYAKAIILVQRQAHEKARERVFLEEKFQEMEKGESMLRVELDCLQMSLAAEKEASASLLEDKKKAHTPHLLSTDRAMKEGEELQRTRAELKTWEVKFARLEQEWALLLQNSTRLPSAAQREKELERRLRNLSDELVTKQVQADALTKERTALDFQLGQINATRRQTLLKNTDGDAHRTRTLSSAASDTWAEESQLYHQSAALEGDQVMVAAMKRAFRHAAEAFWSIWRSASKKWSRPISIQLRTFTALRILIMFYVLSLHVVAFVVISSSAT